jgi:putative component of membrane protein insertase Oxa1/YidC/SpoIIIJ protein YidD
MNRRLFFIALFFICAGSCCLGFSENGYELLVEKVEGHRHERGMIKLYQELISMHDGPRCLFSPSCSEFYRMALDKYGALRGTLMLIDRILFRENRWSLKYYSTLEDDGRFADPPHHNNIFDSEDYYR